MLILLKTDVCHFCADAAIALVYSRNLKKTIPVCNKHGKKVLMEDTPAYITQCKNCGCFLPVG